MHASLFLSSFLLAGCLLAPTRTVGQAGAARPLTAADPFPVPQQGLTVHVNTEAKTTLQTLLDDFTRVTGQNLVTSDEVRQQLRITSCGLSRDVEVPPERVWQFVESLLIQNDFMVEPLTSEEPRLLAVRSLLQGRAGLRGRTPFIHTSELAVYERHPAMLITTMIELPNTDVRTLSNSMRTMFTDANTQQIIPVANSNTLIITGFGPAIANLVGTLEATDEAQRRGLERSPAKARKKASAEKSPPKEATEEEPKRDLKENPKDQEPPR